MFSQRTLTPAVQAFDAVAPRFDQRYGAWASVTAQRNAVHRELLHAFPEGSSLLELGGGTGVDACFMGAHGRRVLLTDGAPSMITHAAANVRTASVEHMVDTRPLMLEELEDFAAERAAAGAPQFDGAYSNFAALNCVEDLSSVGRGLAGVIRPGGKVVLVVFGPFSVGEVVVQLLLRDVRAAFRRFQRGDVPARLGGQNFFVRYPSPWQFAHAFAPYFKTVRTRGIGVFVPPSAAEPGITGWPRLLRALELMDRAAAAPLALLADHVALTLRRSDVPLVKR